MAEATTGLMVDSMAGAHASNGQTDGSTQGPLPRESAARRRRPPFLTFWRKTLLTLMGFGAVSAIVGATMQGTRSSFTATVANSGNSFTAGTLTMSNDNNNGSVCSSVVASNCGTMQFSTGRLQPGAVYQQSIKITNSGSLPATMRLYIQNATDPDGLRAKTNFTIQQDGGTCLYPSQASACPSLTNLQGVSYSLTTGLSPTGGYYTLVGSGTSHSLTTAGTGVGDISGIAQWAANGENHTFTFSVEIDPTSCTGFSPTPLPTPNPTPAVNPTPSTCDGNTVSFDVVWIGLQ